MTVGGGPEHTESSGARNAAPLGLGTTRGVIDQQQHLSFLLGEKDGRSLARIEPRQRCVVLCHSRMVAHPQLGRAQFNLLRHFGRGIDVGQLGQHLWRNEDLAV